MSLSTLMLFLVFSLWLFSSCYAESCNEPIQHQNFIHSPNPLMSIHNNEDQQSVHISPQDGLMVADKINALPGQPKDVNFDQYSGYVTVDPVKERALFYYFVESPQEPDSKPLVLWLNGGPGCSSLGAGAMRELGPFRVNSDGKTLASNEASWNNVANVLFLESPVGVGFSYSNSSSEKLIIGGDKSTAADSYVFLLNWLERFPHYKSRDFFIAGESYAGHYIPQLASLILEQNEGGKQHTIIQLKGIAMGNAFVDVNSNDKANIDYMWTHALVGDESYNKVQLECDFSTTSRTDDCDESIYSAYDGVGLGHIDLYNIYAPVCMGPSNATTSITPDPCSKNYVYSYLNLAEVQKALHVAGDLPYPWELCRNLKWDDRPETVLPTIQKLIETGLRVWFYSGDQDAVVPVTSTRYAIDKLGLQVESHWAPWRCHNEVGGYVVGYKGLTFATVRGAGHMVPSDQPDRALTLFSAFLNGAFS